MANKNGGFIGTDGLDAPDPPTIDSATAGNEKVSVAFTAPTDTGTSAITGFVVQVSTDGTDYSAGSATGTSSPIEVSSLTNDTAATAKVWAINVYGTSAPSDASSSFTPFVQTRGIFAGGSNNNTMDYINITSTGDATDFGDMQAGNTDVSSASNAITGLISTKRDTGTQSVNTTDSITIATTGNASNFGNLTVSRAGGMGCSNSTRAIFQGGKSSSTDYNTIDFATIGTTGSFSDFGDLTQSRGSMHDGGVNSSTRGIAAGGYREGAGSNSNVIDYITMASAGDATDFGDLVRSKYYMAGASSSTRGLFAGGDNNSTEIMYITIGTTGNTTDFGDCTSLNGRGGVCTKTRAVFGGGDSGPSNVMDYVTIASTGDTTDFGDLTVARAYLAGVSGDHGGIA